MADPNSTFRYQVFIHESPPNTTKNSFSLAFFDSYLPQSQSTVGYDGKIGREDSIRRMKDVHMSTFLFETRNLTF